MANENDIQWHPGFCSAMELTLRDDRDALSFDKEFNLSRKPLQVDLLVIHKNEDMPVKNRIGKIFKKNNLFEYKSPEDSMSIDTYYKVVAYGCLYKSLAADHVDAIKASEITLTMVRDGKPDKMLAQLVKEGITLSCDYPGIYSLGGKLLFDTQIVVTRELPKKEYIWLQALTKDLDRDDASQLLIDAKDLSQDTWEGKAADSVLQVALSANQKIFEKLKKEDPVMCDALKELMKPEIEEEMKKEKQKDRQDSIKNLKKNGATLEVLYKTYGKDLVDKVLGNSEKS